MRHGARHDHLAAQVDVGVALRHVELVARLQRQVEAGVARLPQPARVDRQPRAAGGAQHRAPFRARQGRGAAHLVQHLQHRESAAERDQQRELAGRQLHRPLAGDRLAEQRAPDHHVAARAGRRRHRYPVARRQPEGGAFGGGETQRFGDAVAGADHRHRGGAGAGHDAAGKADQVVDPFAGQQLEGAGKRYQAIDRHHPFGARYPYPIAGRQRRVGGQLAARGEARQIEPRHRAAAGQFDAPQTGSLLRPAGRGDQVGDARQRGQGVDPGVGDSAEDHHVEQRRLAQREAGEPHRPQPLEAPQHLAPHVVEQPALDGDRPHVGDLQLIVVLQHQGVGLDPLGAYLDLQLVGVADRHAVAGVAEDALAQGSRVSADGAQRHLLAELRFAAGARGGVLVLAGERERGRQQRRGGRGQAPRQGGRRMAGRGHRA